VKPRAEKDPNLYPAGFTMNFNNLDSRSSGFRSPTGKSSAFPRLAMLVVLGLFSHSAFAMLCKNGGNPISGISHPSTYTTPVTDFDLYGTGTNQIKVHISKNDKITPCIGHRHIAPTQAIRCKPTNAIY
jgi:hypothetical protein